METIKLADGVGNAVIRAAGVLRQGGVILYPTDTVYGLGADALSESAIAKVYDIKSREARKPLHAVVSDLEMAARYAEVNDIARTLAERFLPGPLTLVLKKKADADPAMSKGRNEFAVRIPKNDFCLELARSFGQPYTTTSANVSGEESKNTPAEILTQLGDKASLIGLVIDAGELAGSQPSTIVTCVSGFPSILREGAIPASAILV